MHALNDVVKAGYAHYIGMSSCYAYECKWRKRSIALISYLTAF